MKKLGFIFVTIFALFTVMGLLPNLSASKTLDLRLSANIPPNLYLFQELERIPSSVKGWITGCREINEEKGLAICQIGLVYKLIIYRETTEKKYELIHSTNEEFQVFFGNDLAECLNNIIPSLRHQKVQESPEEVLINTFKCVPLLYKGWAVRKELYSTTGYGHFYFQDHYQITVMYYKTHKNFRYTLRGENFKEGKIYMNLEEALEQIPINPDYKGKCSW